MDMPNTVYTKFHNNCQKRWIPNILGQMRCIPKAIDTAKIGGYQIRGAKCGVYQSQLKAKSGE